MSTENTSGDDPQPQADQAAFSIDNIIGELVPELEASQSTEAVAEPEEAEAEPEQRTEVVDPPAKEALSPLLAEKARREREARAEIEALKGSTEQAIADARQALVQELKDDPQGFIAKYGIENAGDLAMHFYAADLGDDAPDDLKQQIGMNDFDRFKAQQQEEFSKLRSEIAQREEIARNQAVIDQYNGFLSEVPADLPYLSVEAQHDQQEALKTMAQVADHMFQQNGQYPSAFEVAKVIEREISTQAARYAAIGKEPTDVKPVPQTEQVEKKPIQTLSTDLSKSKAKKRPIGEEEHFESALELFETMLGGNS